MTKRVADLLVETLEAAGVKTCYGIVGDTLNRIAHAIDRSGIDWVHMRHEEAGAFAAGGEAQRPGRLATRPGPAGPRRPPLLNRAFQAAPHTPPPTPTSTPITPPHARFTDKPTY